VTRAERGGSSLSRGPPVPADSEGRRRLPGSSPSDSDSKTEPLQVAMPALPVTVSLTRRAFQPETASDHHLESGTLQNFEIEAQAFDILTSRY
jgi:hypothetical protein